MTGCLTHILKKHKFLCLNVSGETPRQTSQLPWPLLLLLKALLVSCPLVGQKTGCRTLKITEKICIQKLFEIPCFEFWVKTVLKLKKKKYRWIQDAQILYGHITWEEKHQILTYMLFIINILLSISHKSLEFGLIKYKDLRLLNETFNLVSFVSHYLFSLNISAVTKVASNCS